MPAPALIEGVQAAGIVGEKRALRQAAYLLARMLYRREEGSVQQDMDGLLATMGSMVGIAHDAAEVGAERRRRRLGRRRTAADRDRAHRLDPGQDALRAAAAPRRHARRRDPGARRHRLRDGAGRGAGLHAQRQRP